MKNATGLMVEFVLVISLFLVFLIIFMLQLNSVYIGLCQEKVTSTDQISAMTFKYYIYLLQCVEQSFTFIFHKLSKN